jgi:hypothetical protein
MRVCFVNCRGDEVDETALLKNLMRASKDQSCIEVSNPAEANLILITGILEKNTFETLRNNSVWRKYPEKCFGYSEIDNPPAFLRGVYSSAVAWKGVFNRMQSCGYSGHGGWSENRCSSTTPFYTFPKKYLFSFIGRKSHPVRKRIFRTAWPDNEILIIDTTRSYDHFKSIDKAGERMQAGYWEVLSQSKYALCPRGAGASSIRLFEAMQAGVAPVIISDAWIPALGPIWNEFAIFIPERKTSKIYEVVKSHESEFAERGRLAAAAYARWFSKQAAWEQLLAAVRVIRDTQQLPESWFAHSWGLIYFCELMHEWRYRLPILIKTRLVR